jgi:Ca2+-transporting ATPase
MSRDPEKKGILPHKDLIKIICSGLVMAIGTLGLYIYELSNGSTVIKASTMALTVFILFQLFNVFNCKSETSGFSNKLLIGSVIVSLLLQISVIYLPFFQEIFKTTSIGLIDWMLIIIISGMILVTDKLFSKVI